MDEEFSKKDEILGRQEILEMKNTINQIKKNSGKHHQ
jgi:hypothetical protein